MPALNHFRSLPQRYGHYAYTVADPKKLEGGVEDNLSAPSLLSQIHTNIYRPLTWKKAVVWRKNEPIRVRPSLPPPPVWIRHCPYMTLYGFTQWHAVAEAYYSKAPKILPLQGQGVYSTKVMYLEFNWLVLWLFYGQLSVLYRPS